MSKPTKENYLSASKLPHGSTNSRRWNTNSPDLSQLIVRSLSVNRSSRPPRIRRPRERNLCGDEFWKYRLPAKSELYTLFLRMNVVCGDNRSTSTKSAYVPDPFRHRFLQGSRQDQHRPTDIHNTDELPSDEINSEGLSSARQLTH